MNLEQEQLNMRERLSKERNSPRGHRRSSKTFRTSAMNTEDLPWVNHETLQPIEAEIKATVDRTDLVCPFCKKLPTTASTKTGKLHACAKCRVRRIYLSKYKLTLLEFSRILAEQKNCCAICGIEFDFLAKSTTPCVDHCHDVGHIRGLLCGRCNSGLGFFLDDTVAMKNAINYLDNNKLYRCWTNKGVII